MNKLAIFGGTFNPVHLGHLQIIESLSKQNTFQKIAVMPVNLPPHKDIKVADAKDRLNMCRLAFRDFKNVEIWDDEITVNGKSYTINTLERLLKKGIEKPSLVIGADSLINFHLWYRFEDILKLADLFVYRRSGISKEEILSSKLKLEKKGGTIFLSDICPTDISSTKIRKKLSEGGSVENLLPEAVFKYIISNKLYVER